MRGTARVGVTRHIHALAASCLCVVVLGGCANQTGSAASTQRVGRATIERYMGEVEPIRLAVNKLLGGADPILEAFHDWSGTKRATCTQ
jgi:hypothetical protein